MATSPAVAPPRLEKPLAEHRSAVASFVRAAERVAETDWARPRAEAKWSPAEVTEHVRLSFAAVVSDLEGRPMAWIAPGWQRFLFRRIFLSRILRTGRFPAGVRAPREVRPAAPPGAPSDAIERLRSMAAALEAACLAVRDPARRTVAHPYMGAIRLPDALLLLARHTRHHERQVAGPESPVDRPRARAVT